MKQPLFPVTRREADRLGISYSSETNKNSRFPSCLRKLRKEKGVSQDVLSKELGVSKSTIGLWETGDTLPDAKAVFDLANYFGVSVDYIVGKTDITSTDSNLRNVCEYTGLSEEVIIGLVKLKDSAPYLLSFLNDPENAPHFLNLLTVLEDYNNCKIAESLLQEYSEKLEKEDPDSSRKMQETPLYYFGEAGAALTKKGCRITQRIKNKINQIWDYELSSRVLDPDIGDRNILVDLKVSDVAECRVNRTIMDFLKSLTYENLLDINCL